METMVQIVVAATAVTINGIAFIGFWIWARAQITKMMKEVASLNEWRDNVDQKCNERRVDIQGIYTKIDEVKLCFHSADNKTAQAIGELKGQVDILVGDR